MSEPSEPGAAGPRAPLLIMGSPRSGTTFLAHMVNRFLDIHICRDNGTLLRFHRLLPHYGPLEDDGNLRRLIRDLYADHYFRTRLRDRGLTLDEGELFARVRPRTYGGLVNAVFSAMAGTHGKRSWGYKRASFAKEAQRIDELFPNARFVHIIRDARDVVLSMRTSTDLLLERSWHFGAVDWTSHIEIGRQLGAQMGADRYYEVRYERFMAEPAAVLAEIVEFTGAGEGSEERLARVRAEIGSLVKSDNTEKWRRAVPPAAIRTIERVAGRRLAELGYPVLNPDIVGAPIGALEMAWLHADRVASNLFRTKLGVMARYRLEVLKGHHRARFSKGASTGPGKG